MELYFIIFILSFRGLNQLHKIWTKCSPLLPWNLVYRFLQDTDLMTGNPSPIITSFITILIISVFSSDIFTSPLDVKKGPLAHRNVHILIALATFACWAARLDCMKFDKTMDKYLTLLPQILYLKKMLIL